MLSSKKKWFMATVVTATLGLSFSSAQAIQKGDLFGRLTASNVSPNDSSTGFSGAPTITARVDGDTKPSFTIVYMMTDNLGFEVLAALPFSATIGADAGATDLGTVATTDYLPPTFSLQYYFNNTQKIRPYVGAGLNYTTFFNTKTEGALANTSLSLKDSFGLAAQAGVDFDLNKDWFLNADIRYIKIKTQADSSALGTADVTIDPWVYTLGVGYKF